MALGAPAATVGRPVLYVYGLAFDGSLGVQSVFEHLRDEMRSTMLLAGARSMSELSPTYLRPDHASAAAPV
ncbi:lactate dehydrogenase [Cupriavidus sp. L7L]|nr:lactate dehydrogenase [Cupriavidus sp. L7L]